MEILSTMEINGLNMRKLIGLVGSVVLVGCGGSTAFVDEPEVETPETTKQREAWSAQDNPSLFTSQLEYRFDVLPLQGEAANIPWAGSYWPTYEDNINYQWAGASSDSPAKKYEKAFGGTNVEDAVSRNHGIDSVTSAKVCRESSECDSFLGETCAKRRGKTEGRCIATWWGICHAWTPAAILLPEPKNPVVRNGVTFQVQDLKALGSLVHNSTSTKFVSLRCNKHSSQPDGGGIRVDRWGRPIDADRECRDTNAGTYHVLLANYLGMMRQAFAEDRTNDYEVWNQPLRSFKVVEKRDVTVQEANRLIGVTNDADAGGYQFNANATRFVYVRSEVKYIGESSAEEGYTAPRIDWYTHTDRYEYVLELDAAGRVIGGEWVGASKKAHPDFLWLPLGPSGTSVAGGAIKYDVVKAMILESSGQGAIVGNAVEVNESATLAKGEWKHFGPFTAAAGAISVELTGSGDADLYVRMNGQPSLNLYDCRPYAGNSTESCTATGPGQLYVSVNGYSAATVSLKIKYVGQAAVDGGVRPDAGVVDAGVRPDAGVDAGVRPDGGVGVDGGVSSHLNVSGNVALNQMAMFTLPVTAGRAVVVRTTAANDVDVYVKLGAAPTTSSYDARGYTTSGNETVRFVPATSGTLYIGVHGYVASAFTLTTADN